jgi:serine/threonine protein kinase
MGTVYEAKALRLNTTVALKETHFTEERLRRQFEREAQLLANLRHAALPRVIDHFDEGDGLYLVMDFVEGDDLWEMLKKRGEPFPVSDVTAWAGQLLDALRYLHTQSPPVIHRDIKPQNLKLTEDGRVILLDFGLAKGMSDAAASQMVSRTVMGFSLPYAPLEQILQIDENAREQLSVLNPNEVERIRRSGTGQRSDLYSVGATLLHLLTAKVPVTSPTRATSIWSNQPDPLNNALAQGVPANLRSFLDSSMALDPERRFASAAEMREALREAVESSTGTGAVLTATVLDPASELKTRPLTDARHDETTRVSPARSPRPEQESRQKSGTRRRTLALGFIVAFIAAFVAAAIYLSLPNNKPSAGNTNANAQPTAQPTEQPSVQPSVQPSETPAAQPSVVSTPEVEERPVNSARNENVRNAPVTSTPTPRPATSPPPTPPVTPTPESRRVDVIEQGRRADADVGAIDNEIGVLVRRRDELLLTLPPQAPAVRRLDRRIANLRRRRAQALQNRR